MNPTELAHALNKLKVGGKSLNVTPEIPTSAGAYTAADCVGGLLQIKDVMTCDNGTAILKSIQVRDNANQKQPLTIILFSSQPTGATTTDNSAFAYGTSSFLKQIAKINILATDYETIDSKATADVDTFGKVLKSVGALDLWAVIITTGTWRFILSADVLIFSTNMANS